MSMLTFVVRRLTLFHARRPALSLLVFVYLFAGLPALPQAVNSAVEGAVTDPTGAVVPTAEVVLTNRGTGATLTTHTNDVGRYVFSSVPAGSYSLKVSMTGFNSYVMEDFKLAVIQHATVNVVLELGNVDQSIVVSAGGLTPLLETNSNELGTLIENKNVANLPLNGRNFLQLGLLAGATAPPSRSGSDLIAGQTGHPSRSIVIAGNVPDLTMYMINGVATVGSRLGHASIDITPAAIDQFKVRQGFFMPGLGPEPAIVNVITKSGNNNYHGEVFEFLRNNALDARNFFDPLPHPGPFRRNQFGGALGGPIQKNKLFFFGSYEGLRQRRSETQRGFTPSARMFNGDLSEVLPTQIFDPDTFEAASGQRQPFPNNIIPSTRISPVSSKLLDYYLPGSAFADRPVNVAGNPKQSFDSDQFTGRADYIVNERNFLFGNYILEDAPVVNSSLFPLGGVAFPLQTQLATVQWTATVNPNVVHELRLGWTRGRVYQAGETEPGLQNDIGITGTADQDGVPRINFSGYSAFGQAVGLIGNIDNLYQVHDAVHYVRGNHQVSFGIDLRHLRTIQQSANGNARGNITFSNQFTSQVTADATGALTQVPMTGDSFGEFLLGIPITGVTSSMPRTHYRATQFEPYIHDSWKLRPNLTLNYGLSYYLATSPTPVGPDKDYPHNVDLRTGEVHFAVLGQVKPQVYNTDHNNFSPRVGLAWQPGFLKDTVVRAGFGTYYASQRMVDHQFAIVATGVTITSSFGNDPNAAHPAFRFGQDVLPPTATVPITEEFARDFTGSIFTMATDIRTGYVQQWNLSIQRTFGQSNLVELNYVGSGAHKLGRRSNPNDCSSITSLVCDPATIPFKQFPFVLLLSNDGNSSYHGLNAKFHRQFSKGFSALVNYTWSKVIGDIHDSVGGSLGQTGKCRTCERSVQSFSIPHRLTSSIIWELPFGRGQRFLANLGGGWNQVLGGWEINAITTFSQGYPIGVTAPNRSGAVFTSFRADHLCDGRASLANGNPRTNGLTWLDGNCYGVPAQGLFGNSADRVVGAPGTNNWDIGIEKSLLLKGDALQMRFRAEFFNAFNHAQFDGVSNNVAAANFGQIVSASEARIVQFGLKILW